MATMSDVAKRAGVSLSTVSYALNGTRPISAATRARIFAAMEELGYQRNAIARGLASSRTRILALLLPSGERGLGITEFEFVKGATEAARKQDYHLILWSAAIDHSRELVQFMQQGWVDGFILMEVLLHDPRIGALLKMQFPFSMIGRCADPTGCSYVDIDFEATVQTAVDYLVGLGHRNFALVNQAQEDLEAGYGPSVRVQAAFAAAMASNGLAGEAVCCHANAQAGYAAYAALAASNPAVTALLVMNERAVPGILQAIAAAGRNVPGDISLLSLVSSPRVAEATSPPLTTLAPPAIEMGRLGVELLIQKLEGCDTGATQVLLPCRLALGGSTGVARAFSLEDAQHTASNSSRFLSA